MKQQTNSSRETNLEKKNFGLNQADFNRLLIGLQKGEDHLYRRVFLAHFDDCLIFLKRKYKVNHQDAYDATMDALIMFCERLKKGLIKYGNLRFLFTQMAGQILVRSQKKDKKLADLPEDYSMLLAHEEDIPDEAAAAFDKAWGHLGQECQKLLKSFFYDRVKLKDVALERGINEATLRKQKQRCVTKLQSVVNRFYKG